MSNIEEDIKRLKAFNPGDEYTEKIKTAIQNILAEREQDKKRIKELEEENATLRKANNIAKELTKGIKIEDITQVINKSYEEFMRQFIPVQKVKDKIEELKKHYNTDNNIRIYTLKDSYELQATVLEELLEEK